MESWVYANASARNFATGFLTGDVGRIAYQQDNGTYWRLTDPAPLWQIITGINSYASLQVIPTNPTGTTSTTAVMMGLGSSLAITPSVTGKMLITITGSIANSTGSVTVSTRIRYGTGSPPANGVAATGTIIGGIATGGAVAAVSSNFSLATVLTGLALGTAIWIDLGLTGAASGTASVSNISVSVAELP